MKRQYNEMQQRHVRPLPPALSPTLPVVATAAASVASAAAHSYPPPQFYFGWGPPHYPPPHFYFGWGPPHYPPPHFYFGWGPHYGQQQGWWPPSHPAPPTPPLMAYSSSAFAINSTFYSIKAFTAATTSIALPTQRQMNMDFRFSKMPKSRQVHTWKRNKYVLDAPKITGGKMAMHIPVEIVIEILVKLPTRSLLRFKSVCKSWHSIIQDRYFISRHLQNNSRRSSCGLNFISLARRSTEFYLCYFVKDVKDWHGFEIRGLEIQTKGEYYTISNSCDGLICVYTNSRTYVVNPSIRDVLELPKVPDQARTWDFSAALVHDPTTGEYRVVRTFVRRLSARTSGCMIFTLGSCSWRFIDDAPLRISKLTIPAVVNETIYWDVSFYSLNYYHNGPEIAVSLDMQSETFDTVMHPHSYSASISSQVFEVGGYLCLLDKMSRNMHQQTLWTLKDYRNNRWTKQIINLEKMENVTVGLACQFKPLALRDGKILISNHSNNRLDFYDPVTGCFDKPSYVAYKRATAYIESLISPTEIQNKAM